VFAELETEGFVESIEMNRHRPVVCSPGFGLVSRLVLVALFLCAPIVAASPLRLRLLLADGQPAAGYSVSVVDSTLSAVCDAEGVCTLATPPTPPFVIVAAGPSSAFSAPILIESLSSDFLELTLEAPAADSVTVVSGVAPSLDLLAASAASVVGVEALEQRPPQRLVDVLESVPGASKIGEGADSVPALRGLARGRTLILLDGARVSAERRAGPSATFVDPNGLAAVEVLRGPSSVTYGSDAFGGVIHAVTRDPDLERTRVWLAADGSFGGEQRTGGFAAVSVPIGTAGLLFEVHGADGEGQKSGDGTAIFNSSFASQGGALRLLLPLGSGRLRASLQIERVDDLGKAASDSRQVRAVYPREDADRLVVAWVADPPGEWDTLEATAFYGRYRVVLDRDRAATPTSARRVDSADTDARDASLRLVTARSLSGGRLQLGVDAHTRFGLTALVARTDFEGDGSTVVGQRESAAIADAAQRSYGLFVTWSRPFAERWRLGLGARGDQVDTKNRGGFFGDRTATAEAASGNVSLAVSLPAGWTATAQAARGFRVPTLSDRYFRGPSGRGFVTGNPDLKPETSLQSDLSLRRAAGRSALGFYAYRYDIRRLIERYAQGADFAFRNRGEARIEGVEAEFQAHLARGFSLEAGAAWVRSRGDGEPLDDAPAPGAWLTGRWAFPRGYAFTRVAGFDRKDDPGPTEVERPGYGLWELGGGYHLTPAVELRLTVRNTLDRHYTGSPDETADRSPGRAIALGVSGRF
jgi:outer membrane receptor protein involved in Fe transport